MLLRLRKNQRKQNRIKRNSRNHRQTIHRPLLHKIKEVQSRLPSNNQQTQTCVKNGTWKPSFDGKFASYDYSEALAWGKENCPENHQAMIYTIHDVCGNQAFGVYFFPTHD